MKRLAALMRKFKVTLCLSQLPVALVNRFNIIFYLLYRTIHFEFQFAHIEVSICYCSCFTLFLLIMESFLEPCRIREHEIVTFDSYGNNSQKTKA